MRNLWNKIRHVSKNFYPETKKFSEISIGYEGKKYPRRFLTYAMASVVYLAPNVAVAAGHNFTDQKIQAIITGWEGEGMYLQTNNTTLVDGCGPTFMLPLAHPMFNPILSIALTAYSTSATVILRADGCYDSTNMKLKAIQIVK